jgi:hypothetical protein
MNITFKEQETIRRHVEVKRLLAENGLGKFIRRIEHVEAAYDVWLTTDQNKVPMFKTEIENGPGSTMREFYGEGIIN